MQPIQPRTAHGTCFLYMLSRRKGKKEAEYGVEEPVAIAG